MASENAEFDETEEIRKNNAPDDAGVEVEVAKSHTPRTCRFCLMSEEEQDGGGSFIAPCKCTGSAEWVHTHCLAQWIKTVAGRRGNSMCCELCKSPYELDLNLRAWRFWWVACEFASHPWMSFIILPGIFGMPCLWWFAIVAPWFITAPAAIGCALYMPKWLGIDGRTAQILVVLSVATSLAISPYVFTENQKSNSAQGIPELRPGMVLRFIGSNSPMHAGPFASSVVLLTSYDYRHGATGYIINKPFYGNMVHGKEKLIRWPTDPSPEVLSRMILGYGGPVKNYSTALLKSAVDDDDDRDGWDAIHWSGQQTTSIRRASESGMAGVHIGGRREDILDAIVDSMPPPNPKRSRQADIEQGEKKKQYANHVGTIKVMMLHGYVGWSPSQLDNEIRKGAWTIHKVTPEVIFETPPKSLHSLLARYPSEGYWGRARAKTSGR